MGNQSGSFIYKLKHRLFGKRTSIKSQSSTESRAAIDHVYLETFLLVWLDPNVDTTKENIHTQKRLREIVTGLITFDKVDICEQWLKKCCEDEKIILIASGAYGEEIVPKIHDLPMIITIYIYCLDVNRNKIWAKNHSKIRSVQSSTDKLLEELSKNQNSLENVEDSKAIQICKKEESKYSLNTGFASKIWYLLFLEILLSPNYIRSQCTSDELIEIFRRYSSDDEYGLNLIDEFIQTYQPKKAISWLTRDTPFVRFVNKALREEDINIMFPLRFFLIDVYQQLIKHQAQSLNVFKLQLMSKTLMEEIKANSGQFLFIHTFLFASTDQRQLMSTVTNNDQFETVLFDIKVEYRPGVAPYAYLHDIDTNLKDDIHREVLFMCGSSFEVGSLLYEDSIWKLHLKLTSENDIPALLNMKEKLRESQDLNIVGDLLSQKNEENKAKIYFDKLQNELSKSHTPIQQQFSRRPSIVSDSNVSFILINLSEHMTEMSSEILTSLCSFASKSILIINDNTTIDFSRWSKKSRTIFTTTQFSSSIEHIPKSWNMFLLDDDEKKASSNNQQHFQTIDELIARLVDRVIEKYRLDINPDTKSDDSIVSKKSDKQIQQLYQQLKHIHEKYTKDQPSVMIQENVIPILIWFISNATNDEEDTNYIEKTFGDYFSSYQTYFTDSEFHEKLVTDNTADIFVIFYNDCKKSIVKGIQQFPNVKYVYHYDGSKTDNDVDDDDDDDKEKTYNRNDLCYSITTDLIDYHKKLGEHYRIINEKKQARDMFLKAKQLCQFLSTICFSEK